MIYNSLHGKGPKLSSAFFCHDGKGNFVMHKRSQNCRDEKGCWESGGGEVEFGEDPRETAVREIGEEYGTKPLEIQFVGYRNILRDEGKSHWVALLWVARVNRDEVKIGDPEKMDKIGWFNKHNLPEPLHSQFLGLFEEVQKINQDILSQALNEH